MEFKRNEFMKLLGMALIATLLFSACNSSPDYAPKPRGYFRIVFPKKEYQQFDSAGCPFTFTYPKYAVVEPDKRADAKPCWLNMQFPQFEGTLHLSYQPIRSKKDFNELIEDAHTFAFKHSVKASGIEQGIIYNPDNKIFGIYYTIEGNAASSAQFFLTDSTRNYLRGALYFNTEPRLDSIQPVLDFVKKDVKVMIQSFKWK
jgi:gliding motility-associated lipoprotein GldD